jgi:hypothetical protein
VRLVCLALLLAGGVAHAGGPGELTPPRAVGRAGVGTVSDDGAGAVLASPAALARRDSRRVQLGAVVLDDGLSHAPDRAMAPVARAQNAPAVLPAGAAITGLGPVVVGLAVAFDRAGRTLAAPDPGLSSESIQQFFAYRYAGMSARYERRTVGLGAAARVTDWLAIGATATLSFIRIEERRRIWAGFTSRLVDVGDPAYDVDVALSGDDNAVPGAVFGAFVAPTQLPLEVAASVAWTNQVHASGSGVDAFAQNTANLAIDTDEGATATARLDVPADTTIRAGARYLGDRFTIEAGFDASLPRDRGPPAWRVDHTRVVDVLTGRSEPLAMTSRFAPRRRYAARAAVDLEVVTGFVWLTAGYAFRTPGSRADRIAPTTADLGGHTAALGVEIAAGGFTASLGWARTFSPSRTVVGTSFGLDDPFDPVVTTAGLGDYRASRDLVGLVVEIAQDD